MAATQIEIQVRTLTGEAITVSVAANDTVEGLKLLLKQLFPPATQSQNFHLFFKGEKLRLQSQIGGNGIKPGEVIVLVPFAKKVANNEAQNSDKLKQPLKAPSRSAISKFANSAWSAMMQDLSYLGDNSRDEAPSVSNVGRFSVGGKGEGVEETSCNREAKRKRGFCCDDVVEDILRSVRSKNVVDEQNLRRFVVFLELVNCLSDPYSGDCMLWRRRASLLGSGLGLHNGNGNSCLCPAWLKKMMKAFAFLNIFSTLIQFQQETTTTTLLEQALGRLGTVGVKLGMEDMEHLSIVSPKVVHFVDENADEISSGNTLLIIKCSTDQNHRAKDNCKSAYKQMDISKVVNALKMQESSFKSNLWEAVERLMFIKRNEISSLDDFLVSVNESAATARGNKAKPAMRSHTASSTHSAKKGSTTPSTQSNKTSCHGTDRLLPVEMVGHLRKGIGSAEQIVHVEDIGARKAVHVEVPQELSENLRSALHCLGISQLYSHQAESIQASLTGKNVVVATMTSSGKSLCYNLPVLEALSQNSSSCALYLFPTKALAQDQLRALSSMSKGFSGSLNIGIYDGDTNQHERTRLRQTARLLITNPDMLHVSILPHHRKFSRILENLSYVVIDEAHVYKGAFGCHTALIIRRLRRLCSHVYGSDPSFVFSTATSANPREHCMELANLPSLELIQKDGSPSARKLFILWNPILSSPIKDVSCLFAEMVQHGLRCIAFCKTRKLCELVFCYTREILQKTAPHLADSIHTYRGGYIPEDRRRIESDFFNGKLCGIAATNALELGIDVGHIDVTLHLGFPGSIASLWQQAGRAGRRERPSLAVYVAFEGPLDQYFMDHPDKLFGSPIECCHVDAKNHQVLEQHLACAALEHPLSLIHDEKFFGSGLNSAIMSLKNRGCLTYDRSSDSSAKSWNYIGLQKKMPSHSVSIRSIERDKYKVMDQQEKQIEEIEESKAFFQVYEGAVYMNQGKTYLVTGLDLSRKIAWCQEADLNYYTKTRDHTDIHVIGGNVAYPAPATVSNTQLSRTTARANPCRVTTTWYGFYRVRKGTDVILEKVDLVLPKYSYASQAVWVPVPPSIKEAVKAKGLDFCAGLHAASHAVLHVVPLRIICNISDLAPECADPNDDISYFPERILLFDQHPGGTGVSVQIQPVFMELLTSALKLLTNCSCTGHCPKCVQSFACRGYNEHLHKDAAIMIIKAFLFIRVFWMPKNYNNSSPQSSNSSSS